MQICSCPFLSLCSCPTIFGWFMSQYALQHQKLSAAFLSNHDSIVSTHSNRHLKQTRVEHTHIIVIINFLNYLNTSFHHRCSVHSQRLGICDIWVITTTWTVGSACTSQMLDGEFRNYTQFEIWAIIHSSTVSPRVCAECGEWWKLHSICHLSCKHKVLEIHSRDQHTSSAVWYSSQCGDVLGLSCQHRTASYCTNLGNAWGTFIIAL